MEAWRTPDRETAAQRFAEALPHFGDGPVLILGHFDADGLAAVAILARALEAAGREVAIRLVGKGENPWDAGFGAQLLREQPVPPGGLIVADLGVRAGEIIAAVPIVIIDHHVPSGVPGAATVISGNGCVPEPTSALLAWWAAHALGGRTPCSGSRRSA